jgi:hypothetical protein
MAITIEPYTEDLIPRVEAFNARLTAGGAPEEFRLPEHHRPDRLPKRCHGRIYEEYFLAVDDGVVRGGCALKHQDFAFGDLVREIVYYHSPVSEGIVDRVYTGVGVQLLRHALKAQPLLFALGMGGYEQPLPRMLKALGWSMCSVPFHFRVNHPTRFLRELPALRASRSKRLLSDLAALTGTGWLGLKAAQVARAARSASARSISSEIVDGFSHWADELWDECKSRYAMIAVRDHAVLNALYPPGVERFVRVRIEGGGKVLGWAVLLDSQMRGDRYFGNLRVGSIVDCLAVPEQAFVVLTAATEILERRGVDLIVSNQSHAAWSGGLRATGFLEGPSNFIFAASKGLACLFGPFERNRTRIHLNRGDGDGPIHL